MSVVDYGTDWSSPTGLDIDPMGRAVTGAELVAQAVVRDFLEDVGGLFYDADYGGGLAAAESGAVTPAGLTALQTRLQARAEADERVLTAAVQCTYDTTTKALAVSCRGATGAGPFRFVLTADAAGTTLRQLLAG